jgi:3-hydroxyacyl-CoA dehydrogenase / enoyl-CoA hydratase / 3-hydroxybutyryl-CoA epimerase / enoyl-CoA isomerase
MIYQGSALTVATVGSGMAELCFDRQQDRVNKFDQNALLELDEAITAISDQKSISGLLLTSAKDSFIVGADITMFTDLFRQPEDTIKAWLKTANDIFCRLEDLSLPTVSAINGIALGGGLELLLATDYRVMANDAKIGFPEVKLGVIPGFGGTVRLPRVIGADNAIEWIASGKDQNPQTALACGAVDAVVAPEHLRQAGLDLLQQCMAGHFDYQKQRSRKLEAISLNKMEATMAFTTAKGLVAQQAGPHYPAPLTAANAIEKHAFLPRDEALAVEADAFVSVAKTPVANALVGMFLNDQAVKKIAGKQSQGTAEIHRAAVIGAGIMGGGIAFQSASRGTPTVMKDIQPGALETGMAEAGKLLARSVEKGQISVADMAAVLGAITPTLSDDALATVDIVVEAVVENEKVKTGVLAGLEKMIKTDIPLVSNTSTISISRMSDSLERPEMFAGMHFFNPVHRMPLVEVIRGEKTANSTVATVVNYARKLGKTPIVVNDCPGFLVNRVLFPYFSGFGLLMRDGADFLEIDKVMERFGWPMGPAYLLDVIGIDTAVHAADVMADAFPDRMSVESGKPSKLMFEHKRLGQKNGRGFYRYQPGRKGKTEKTVDPEAVELVRQHFDGDTAFDKEDIVHRMMLPMCLETSRCLEENIVASAVEADLAMVLGLGFPPFIGGPLRYIDSIGTAKFVELCRAHQHLGPLYEPTRLLLSMAESNSTFFA